MAQTDETRCLLDWLRQPSKRGLSGFIRVSADSEE
jgi:hypothetical protein